MLFRLIKFLFQSSDRDKRHRTLSAVIETDHGALLSISSVAARETRGAILRGSAWVIDGDTIAIDGVQIRLAGIDAPELDHPYGQTARRAMIGLCRGQTVTARFLGELSYTRGVAVCTLSDGRDLAEELVKLGLAIDWPKYSGGRYRMFEPPGIRRKLWRCEARQRGRMPPRT